MCSIFPIALRLEIAIMYPSCYSLITGKSHSSEISQELILLGSGNIAKCTGICVGKRERRMLVSAASLRCHSQERTSATLFFFTGNHCLYPLMSASINNLACCGAVMTWTDAWSVFNPSLLNFTFLIHPSAAVLSVIDKTQLPLFNRFLSRSIQGVMIAARYLSRLFIA
jgi:hypothetical protein